MLGPVSPSSFAAIDTGHHPLQSALLPSCIGDWFQQLSRDQSSVLRPKSVTTQQPPQRHCIPVSHRVDIAHRTAHYQSASGMNLIEDQSDAFLIPLRTSRPGVRPIMPFCSTWLCHECDDGVAAQTQLGATDLGSRRLPAMVGRRVLEGGDRSKRPARLRRSLPHSGDTVRTNA